MAISPFGHRKVALSSRGEFVIARNVAISVVQGWRTVKREIASQARNDKDSCHREERSDLGCSGLADSQKRDCRAALAPPKGGFDRIQARLLRRLATPKGGFDKIQPRRHKGEFASFLAMTN